jgi:TolB-like protein/AraC-like DNA-binding protein
MAFAQSGKSEFLEKLNGVTEANLSNEQFGVSDLAREMGMSRSNLHRKVKSVAGTSISQFIRQVRLKKALELLQQTSLTISEVAFECGFHSVSYFTKCFHDFYGYSPGKAGKGEADEYNSEGNRHHHIKPGINKKRLTIILSSAVFVIIAVFVVFFIFRPFATRNQTLDKSIAVLPFINDSPEEAEMYFINGTMDAILNNLSKIEDLRVPGRTSVEQYRNNPKPIPEIAKELNVSYILEGSGLRHGDRILLNVQLIDAIKDRHIWSGSYNKKIEEVFKLYSEIAQVVAAEIEARIKPEEKQLIEKVPTANLTAYDFFQRGRDEQLKYWSGGANR